MNENEKAQSLSIISEAESVDFDELESQLESNLEDSLAEWEFLEQEQETIDNPDNLGKAVLDVVWEQCINQIGAVAGSDFIKENRGLTLDLRKEAHIQTTENFAQGKIATHNQEIDYQKRYDDWQDNFQHNEDGTVKTQKDRRTGEEKAVLKKGARDYIDKGRPKGSSSVHKDHTVSAGEIIRDPEAAAHMSREEHAAFANSDKNLNDLDAAANESKGDSKMSDWLDSERDSKKPKDRFDIDEEKLREKDKEAREEYEKRKEEAKQRSIESGKRSRRNEAFKIGGKALRAAVMGLLADLVKTIIGKLIIWLKSAKKKVSTLLEHIKEAIKSFLSNIKEKLLTSAKTIGSTIANAIFGPVASMVQKIWTMIKQGGKSVKEAISYVKNPKNREKSFSVLMLEIGKIVVAGMTAVGAMLLGEVIEKALMQFGVFAVQIPLLGSLASLIGMFLGAIVAGIAGALVLHLINKLIAKKKKQELSAKRVDAGNKVLSVQAQQLAVRQAIVQQTKLNTAQAVDWRHRQMQRYIEGTVQPILSEPNQSVPEDKWQHLEDSLSEI